MLQKVLSILFILSLSFLSGCYNRLDVEDTIYVSGHGFDFADGSYVYSAQLALSQSLKTSPSTDPIPLVLSEKGEGLSIAARRLMLSLPRQPLWSLADIIIISENLARQDTGQFVDLLFRNPNFRINTMLFLAHGSTPEEILKITLPSANLSASGLERVISNQEAQAGMYLPVSTKEFIYRSAAAGIEPVIPQVAIKTAGEGQTITLQGLAVIKGQKMVGSLNEQESQGYRLLSPGINHGGLISVKDPNNSAGSTGGHGRLFLELSNILTTTKPVFKDNKPIITIKVTAEGNLFEEIPEELQSSRNIPLLEKEAALVLKKDIEACIKKAKDLKSDILGWGLEISRYYPQEWQYLQENWNEQFPLVEYELELEYKLRHLYSLHN
ncbi:MAG: Ger(x)C family spore germination protein [Syntrophomonadaceae bacterium]